MSKYKDSLGDRMKTYEAVPKNYLTRRTPVIIRLDGCHFHTFTTGLHKPFDNVLTTAMRKTMKYMCENIQNCVLGYTQSDEITLVLCDYKNINTAAWFDNQVQKIVSVSSAFATFAFNKFFTETANYTIHSLTLGHVELDPKLENYCNTLKKRIDKGALFDSRCFNIPKEEVCNCLIWRQQDATRNSIQSLAQCLFSHKELDGLNCNMLQDKMFTEKDVNWNDLPTSMKRGTCCIKDENNKWFIDTEIPVFTQDRNYVESRIYCEEED